MISAPEPNPGIAGRVAHAFIASKLTILILLASLLLGLFAVVSLPREEEPQIHVPMVDVLVAMPGASAREVEQRVSRPMEQLLWEIPGVEYVYSTSSEGRSLVIVRFKVGEDLNASLVRLNQKLESNRDRIPAGVSPPLIQARTIDDVPILTLTLHSARYDHLALRRLAAQVADAVKQVPQVAATTLIGGDRRELRVLFDPARLAAHHLAPLDLATRLQAASQQDTAGRLTGNDREVIVQTGSFIQNAADAGAVVVGVESGKPVCLREVARIVDGPGDPAQYVFFGTGAARGIAPAEPAVTLAIAKRPGANATAVARQILAKVDTLRGRVIPADVQVEVTRDYGVTAAEKSNELLRHMLLAILSVSLLILLALGWRESLIVALAIPATLALTLLVFYLAGFTLNRITLFALIFSIGILVDDAIVVVENIARHFRLPAARDRSPVAVALAAVAEVGNPTILATFAVIAAVLPMAFVGGMMGPYMRPIPIGAGAAMLFSLAVSFIITPWAAVRILRRGARQPDQLATGPAPEPAAPAGTWFTRRYTAFMRPLLFQPRRRWLLLAGLAVLLLGSLALVAAGWVRVKMLPFDNKDEFQIILNLPEGASLERTARAAQEIAEAVRGEPEVTDYQIYDGVAAPFNFNGLVRHYFLRRGANVADLQINLLPRNRRATQSHALARRIRPRVAAIAARYDARVAVAEVPPGPPVLQTLVAEIYGPTEASRLKLARQVIDLFHQTPGVVDTDWYIEAPQPKVDLVVDREKAALNSISDEDITRTLHLAVSGNSIGLLHAPRELEPVEIITQLPRADRVNPEDLLALQVRGAGPDTSAPLVPLRELVTARQTTTEPAIYHKNLMPVTYVVGDVAGAIESPVYAILAMNRALARLDTRRFGGDGSPLRIYNAAQPFSDQQPGLKWDGEWQVTLEVFRDLGIAFAAVLALIYLLLVGWFKSFLTPLVVMAVIPFSLVGVLPAHGLMHAFFTATSMIGFMAGAGIIVRNSIILVDFIELRAAQGWPLAEAVIEAGAIRFRPIMLTALAVVAGAAVILTDPIFQGLALSLMAGSLVSMFIAPVLVPLLYFMARRHPAPAPPATAAK